MSCWPLGCNDHVIEANQLYTAHSHEIEKFFPGLTVITMRPLDDLPGLRPPTRVCQINRARNLHYKRTDWFFDTLPYL